jgi:polysaccharide export outer membrane protein
MIQTQLTIRMRTAELKGGGYMSRQLVKIGTSVSIVVLMLVSLSGAVYAQSPSAAQMAAFKSLSPAEQQRLAQQFGVEIPSASTSVAQQLPQTLVKDNAPAPVADVSTETAEGEDVIAQQNIEVEESRKQAENRPRLRYFGYNVFSGTPTSFTPIADLPVPLDYIVGPGDELSIQLFGKENERYLLTVGRDGAIDMPKLGPISVAGSSFKQVKEDLALRIKKQIIGAEVSIGMGQLRLMQIYILGDAAHPGAYNLSSLATVSQALIVAGGIAETGSLRKIEVRRGNRSVAIIDLYDLLIRGDLSNDVRLQSGDAVFVHPVGSRVAIDGEVLRPAVYEVKQATLLKDLISIAGGLLPEAYDKSIQVKRQGDAGIKVVTQDLSQASGQVYRLKAGDSVFVQKRNTGFREQIVLSGAFIQPGRRGYSAGLRVSDVLGDIDANLRDDADLSVAILVREQLRKVQVYYLKLQSILNNPQSPDNLNLQPGDELVVMPTYLSYQGNNKGSDIAALAKKRAELIEPALHKLRQQSKAGQVEQSIEISGPVKYPGIYPYAAGLSLADALVLAGDLGEKTERNHAEISRLSFDGGGPELNHIFIDLSDAASVQNFTLQPRDHINIFRNNDWDNTNLRMTLTGEVKFPGSYVVQRGTTIKQLIERAGGLTEYAFPEGAVLSRVNLKEREQEQLKRLNDRLKEEIATLSLRKSSGISGLSVSPKEAIKVVDALDDKEALGRLVVDLPAILASEENGLVVIQDGDRMNIPAHNDTVTVVGEVQYASSHLYEKGLSYKDYIARAGGVRQRADKDRVYIIRASGEVVLPKNSWFGINVNEGDTVVVPIDAEYTDKLSTFNTLTQILYQMGVAYDVIAR